MRFVSFALLLGATSVLAAPAQKPWRPGGAPATPAKPSGSGITIDGVRDRGQFLPDSATLAQVDGRAILARDFVQAWFASDPNFRPASDSAGRAEMLETLIHQQVLTQEARRVAKPLSFENRATLRSHTQRVLSNVAYQRLVLDSVIVTEPALRRLHEQSRFDQRFRQVRFDTRATAERALADLRAGRLRWEGLRGRVASPADVSEIGWLRRDALAPDLAMRVWGLRPGEYSEVLRDASGFRIVQSMEQRPRPGAPTYESVRSMLRVQLRDFLAGQRAESVQAELRAALGVRRDTANVNWLSTRFRAVQPLLQSSVRGSFDVSDAIPEFAPADTARVLSSWRGGRMTVGSLLSHYLQVSPLVRPPLATPEAVEAQIDAVVLEPEMAELAKRRGLDRDSLAVALIDRKRDEMLVEAMFRDSVESRVTVSSSERRAWYAEKAREYVTPPSVRYAAFLRARRSEADSLAEQLRSGQPAVAIVRGDSLAGRTTSAIKTLRQSDPDPFRAVLFEQMRPGEVRVVGPDDEGMFGVLQSLAYDPGRPYAFEEVEQVIDESIQNVKSEALLKALMARLRAKHTVVAHPERLPRVRLVDPLLDTSR